jgi:glycosyltransferase involved in cell wall biosynthesis
MLRALSFILSSGNLASRLRNLLLYADMRLRRRGCAAVWDSCFDAAWYAAEHPEVAASGIPAWLHFLIEGAAKGFNPSPSFHTAYYLYRHLDVARSGVNPLLHYALHGWRERRPVAAAPGCRPDGSRIPLPQREEWRKAIGMPSQSGPLVTVVIPCFNYGRYLDEAVRSIEEQTLNGVEIIVVEGGSTDGETPALVRELEAARGDRVKFFYRGRACPVGDNRNFGIARAQGSLICCLDADDMLRPTFLEVAAFAALAGGYDLVSPSLEMFGESNERWIIAGASFPEIADANQVTTCALFRKAAWSAVGGYRDFGAGADYIPEDWDLWLRMLAHGARSLGMRRTLLRYRVHSRGISAASRVAEAHFRERIREVNRELLERPLDPLRPPPPRPEIEPASVRRLLEPQDRKPAILLALPFVTVGGAEKLMASLVGRWMELGYRVLVISTNLLGPSMPDHSGLIESATPHYYPLPDLFGVESPLWADFLQFLILRYRVETLLITGSEYAYTQLPLLRQLFPRLLVVDQLFNHEGHMASNRFYADAIDLTIVPTPWLANFIQENHAERAERIAVIPHAIEPEPLRAGDDALLPPSFEGKPEVGFFGRFSPEKGPLEFVEIAARVAGRSGAMFLMAGDGPMRPRVEALIRKRGLEGRIHLPGMLHARQVPGAMARCAVVVTPSILDGMPLAIFEAQAQARPVIASRVGSIPAMIEDGVTGWLCDAGDVEAFAGRIAAALADEALRDRVGRAAREAVERRQGTLAMARDYLDAFIAARERKRSDVLPE